MCNPYLIATNPVSISVPDLSSLQCPFIDISRHPTKADPNVSRFHESLVEDALRALIESIRHRSGLLNIYKSTPNNAEPDIR